ncbi:MAG: DUF2764 family protein [Kiritimatiellia bacterium]|nr:DUF2764 domain-containing protein [Lentisphaerota bacterium]
MYYYFCASLPALTLGEKPAWTLDEFVEACRRVLRDVDYRATVALLNDSGDVRSGFAHAWRQWDAQMRNALARWRAGRLGVDVAARLLPHQGYDCGLEREVAEACARGNPLERELALDRLRWLWAEEAARPAPFALPAVLGFALKLRLAWRWAGMQEEQAETVIKEFMESDPAAAAAG